MAEGIGGLTGRRREKLRKTLQAMIAYATVAYAIIADTIYT
jgi:hypothetical protein